MKNKLSDLNNHLFAQMERLSDEDLSAEQIEQEVKRAGSIIGISDQIISNANLQLKAVTLIANHGDRFKNHLPMLEDKKEPDGKQLPIQQQNGIGSEQIAH